MMLNDVWWVISLPKDSCKKETSQVRKGGLGDGSKAFMSEGL